MRKRISLLLGGALLTVMVYGLVGSGAAFTDRWTGSQDVQIGRLTVTVTSDTPGAIVDAAAKTISFPAVDIRSSSTPLDEGIAQVQYSHFRVASTGSIRARIAVRATVETSSGVEAEKFTLVRDGGTEGPVTIRALPVTNLVVDGPQTTVIDDAIGLVWNDLGNDSMGGTVKLSIAIDASESTG
jgi:hypothetical protein